MSFIATRENEILSKMGFNKNMTRPLIETDIDNISFDDLDTTGVTKPDNNANITSDSLGGKYLVCSISQHLQHVINKVHESGGGTILVDNGVHKPGMDITLYSNIYLVGRNSESAIIDFESGAYGVKAIGSNAYSTGTLAVTHAATAVVGTGTTWTSGMIGRSILLSGLWYPIVAVADATHLTIALNFADSTLSGATYVIATPIEDVKIENLTIKNSVAAAVKFQYLNEGWILDSNVQTSAIAIDIDDTSNIELKAIDLTANAYGAYINNTHYFVIKTCGSVITTTGAGFAFDGCTNATFNGLFSLKSATDGFSFANSGPISIVASTAKNSGDCGMELISDNNEIIITNCGFYSNGDEGCKLTATSDDCIITGCLFKDNTAYGINIAASTCDNNIIRNNQYDNNTSGDYNDDGTNTKTDAGIENTGIVTAGETINGATLPVAVYINTSDNEFYACDANDSSKLGFAGFAITDGTDGNEFEVQFTGLVPGFSGLTEGVYYYVQDDKTIGTALGTYGVLVGVAINATELLLLRNNMIAYGSKASDDLQASADTERTRTVASYAKLKQITVNVSGYIRIKFDIKDLGGAGNNEDAELRKNDVVLHTDIDATTSWVTHTYNKPASAGDQIQLYGKGDGSNAVYVRNFRIYFVLGVLVNTVVDTD